MRKRRRGSAIRGSEPRFRPSALGIMLSAGAGHGAVGEAGALNMKSPAFSEGLIGYDGLAGLLSPARDPVPS